MLPQIILHAPHKCESHKQLELTANDCHAHSEQVQYYCFHTVPSATPLDMGGHLQLDLLFLMPLLGTANLSLVPPNTQLDSFPLRQKQLLPLIMQPRSEHLPFSCLGLQEVASFQI